MFKNHLILLLILFSKLEINIDFLAQLKDGFGIMIPKMMSSLVPINIQLFELFILPNTEIKFDTVLAGFEYYASSNGSFIVYLSKINECGSDILTENCGNFFLKTKTISPIINQYNFNVNSQKLGQNFFWLTNFVKASPGWIITLYFNSNGRVAVQDLNDSYYEDYKFSFGNILQINSSKKLNFLFRVLTAQDYFYSKNVQFNKTYSFEGSYNVTIFNTSKTFNVTSCKIEQIKK